MEPIGNSTVTVGEVTHFGNLRGIKINIFD